MNGLLSSNPRASVLVLLGLLSVSLRGQEPVTENHPNGKPFRVYSVDDEGNRVGRFEQFAASGQLEIRASYETGKLHGRFENFHPAGGKKVVAMYHRGRKHGLWREFAADGRPTGFVTYRYDVRHGGLKAFHEDGAVKLVTSYRGGKLHGRYSQLGAKGIWRREAVYKLGKLHGKVLIKRGRKVVSRQKWKDGEILVLDGMQPFPRSVSVLRERIGSILRPPSKPKSAPKKRRKKARSGPPPKPDAKAGARAEALRRLQAYRYLCGLRYADMELVPAWNDLCDAASEVCQANGGLSHHPPKPRGFDAARYRKGKEGAGRSNLAVSGSMIRSVDAYMDDSDQSNIDRIGHRRWCLNPGMKFTGFGDAGRYSAMWSMDGSGSSSRGMRAVFYPPPGKVPVDFFGPRHAWSLSVLRGRAPRTELLSIAIHALDEYFQPIGRKLSLDHVGIADGGYGTGVCLVFRPVGLRVEPGARYLIKVSFDEGKTIAFRYVVEFCRAMGG